MRNSSDDCVGMMEGKASCMLPQPGGKHFLVSHCLDGVCVSDFCRWLTVAACARPSIVGDSLSKPLADNTVDSPPCQQEIYFVAVRRAFLWLSSGPHAIVRFFGGGRECLRARALRTLCVRRLEHPTSTSHLSFSVKSTLSRRQPS